ncbi:poly(3-hydroxybutyrate) depolymerase [Bordetella sp. H567]|uniref:DUF3141 domain-containing protein n=1 Tax=Bordetella sp. H567 TaxID=1697043 RepID=UPI00081CE387|nr:DUF3141 domain-containing protein [Bordetella sp. H567]AOB32536.1 poly(3-hydroxybutyrate) depolymerase [Bordetella sp. H567]
MDAGSQLARSHDVCTKAALVLQKRLQTANERYATRMRQTAGGTGDGQAAGDAAAAMSPIGWYGYAVDAMQRSILFWDTLRQRGNNFVANAAEGLKPVLHFDHEIVADGRTFERPVNYALLRIKAPEGVVIHDRQRPYIIIDPRAGHGPGIGGFKDDSQVGVALRAGHPVYFVVFFRDPEPGQTLQDVCRAERIFVQKVHALHPDAPKPALVGNCQGGWAAMMLAAAGPDDTGPIVINGAPMSYWGGAWSDGEGDNPMRYAGGMLGGSWMASLLADMGNGKFDGAWLVQNFENLNPANSLWEKYYHVYDQADTEPPRFLEFERWWGGFYLMNREEIEWITHNLFIGNKLWKGDIKQDGESLDLRAIKTPIVLFASMGDNITPPQQAFNWVVDVYGSTEEIKSRGQVIVGLLHESVGHLGIFVSGKVAKKEHAQIVSVLKTIESLPPGLYGMTITDRHDKEGNVTYEVEFQEYRLEEVAARLNRFQRIDEKPFEAVAMVSDFLQQGYTLFAQPWVQAMSNDYTARRLRELHPLRVQNWALSNLNPWLWWLAPAAQAVRQNRQALPDDDPLRRAERNGAGLFGAALDYFRDTRDAMTEAAFFTTYGNVHSRYLAGDKPDGMARGDAAVDPRDLPFVRVALEAIAEGGYVEALARVAALMRRQDQPMPLSRLELRHELATEYAEYLPRISLHAWRTIRGQQEIVAQYDKDRAVETLPELLRDPADRKRFLSLVAKLMADERVRGLTSSDAQIAMLDRIRQVLPGNKLTKGKAPNKTAARGRPARPGRRQAKLKSA